MKKILFTGLAFLFVLQVWAQVPTTISFQGYLTDKVTGDPLNGPFDMRFSLYDASTGGAELWFDDYSSVPVSKGLYSVILGDKKPISLPFNQGYYLQMKVGLETLDTRLTLTSSGYSISSTNASNLTGGSIPNARLDTELQDLADGSLSGSLVGPGVIAGNISGTLAVANGGTGAGTFTGIVVGNGTSAMTAVAKTGGTQYFRSNPANTGYEFVSLAVVNSDISAGAAIAGSKIVPSFGSQNISTTGTITGGAITGTSLSGPIAATNITGTLPVATGGTGATGLNGVLFGNGGSAFSGLSSSSGSQYLRRNPSNTAYEFASLAIQSGDISDNTILDADIASGANITGTKINTDFGAKNITTTGVVNASKVGLNTTGTTTLHVLHGNGFANNGLTVETTAVASSNWNIYVASSGDLWLLKAGTQKGTFAGATGAYSSASDRRLKKDIEPMGDITADVMKLSASTYRFREQSPTDDKSIGFIAQDVMKLFPSLVKHNEETDIYTLDYSGFGVLAVKAIQEQQQKIDVLSNEIMELKRAVEILQSNLKK